MAFANNPKIASSGTEHPPEILEIPEAATQSFLKGQLVYTDSGQLKECASDAVLIAGRTLEDASTTENTVIKIERITPSCILKMRVTNGGTAYLNSGALLLKDVAYGLYEASNIVYADVADTTNDAVIYIRPVLDASGGATYWGYFKPVATVCTDAAGTAP